MSDTPKFAIDTVGDLEKLIRRLKKEGAITSKTPVTSVDVDGVPTPAGAGVFTYLFASKVSASDVAEMAIWGS